MLCLARIRHITAKGIAMSIKKWPKTERPREKLLSQGAKNLTDAELMAIFFRVGIAGKSALDLARDCLKQYGDIRTFLNLDQQTFCQTPGLGLTKFAELQALIEINKRYLQQELIQTPILKNSAATKKYLHAYLRDYDHEVFIGLFLNNQQQFIKLVEFTHGTINEAIIYPREIVKTALQLNAAQIILAHNHPSGDPVISEADKRLTSALIQALALINVQVLDHIVVAGNEILSFAERGLFS